jgi:hypothetical protein
LVVVLLGLAFAGLLGHALRLAYGAPVPAATIHPVRSVGGPAWPSVVAVATLAAVVVLFGLHVPAQAGDLLQQAVAVLAPVSGEVGR